MDLVKGCLPLCSGIMQSPVVLQHMSFVFHPKEIVDELESAMRDIMAKKEDIQRELDHPQNRWKLRSNQLERWLLKSGETLDKVNQLLDEYSNGNCDAGSWFQNCYSRYKIGSEAFKLKEKITQLNAEQPEIKFTDIPPPNPVSEASKIMGKKIVSNLGIACSYLEDETNDIIGIWGMGGVGKNTLLKKINQRLLVNANMGFDHVLSIKASQNTPFEELQKEIAKKLHLVPDAGQQDIFNALETKKIVLFLDNIWKPVDLVGLGIINPYRDDDDSTKPYKYKVVFTTRLEDVCAQMRASKRIKVECLEPDEAWDLFKHNVNQAVVESDKKLKEIARQVMSKCGGLPLALQVVGKAMCNRNTVQEWEDSLSSLKNSGIEGVQGGQESLLQILKFSYDTLPRNVQECFLCASLLRWSFSKDDLLELWMCLGLIGNFDNLQQAYHKARQIFKKLEESCLLYSSDDDYVSLHDVIYEMAMWIASDCGRNMNKWIVKDYDWFQVEIGSSNAENWRFANRVIIKCKVERLPILPHQCSDLLCLMLQYCHYLKHIHEGFFQQMPNLTYLDLRDTGIEELPKDIKCLVNLQYLNISNTNISSLPKELVYLKKLQYLICRDLKGLGKVEEDLMSILQKLKVIDIYPSGWVDLEQLKKLKTHVKAIGMRVVSKEVLQQLSCFPTTQLYIENLDGIISLSFDALSCKDHEFLQSLKIESGPQLEQIVMKGRETHLNELEISDVEKLQNIIWIDLSPPEFFHVLKSLSISSCNLDNLAWVMHIPCLAKLRIEDCAEIETLFYIEEREIQQEEVSEHRPPFPALQSLDIINLPKLVSISNFAWDFPQLLILEVRNCEQIETLFYIEKEREIQQQEVSEHRPTFPALIFLIIYKLPKLVSISNFAWDFPRLKSLIVHQCPNLKKLAFKSGINNNNERMTDIGCEREWRESLEWDDATIPSHLQLHLSRVLRDPNECTTSGSK